MLQTQTVEPALLELLKSLMQHESFKDLFLVGGTNLALKIGHRNSVDIDLFGKADLDDLEISQYLNTLGKITILKKSKNIQIYAVNGIKVDFVNYTYPWIEEAKVVDGIRLASNKDIGAMKLNAIAGRGSKKDFIDLYFLLQEFSIEELVQFYENKYHDGSSFMVLKSLTYFEDAEKQEMPIMYKKVTWPEVKQSIQKSVNSYNSIQ
jgi:hypothetical protein